MTVEEKALELVADNRVILEPGSFPWQALVAGHHGHYWITATENDVTCDCPARGRCAHELAAMVVWHEEQERMKTMPW